MQCKVDCLIKLKPTIGNTAVFKSSLLSLNTPSSVDKSLVSLVRASVHASLPMDMKALSEP